MRWLLLNESHVYEIFVMVFVVVKYYLLHGILTFYKVTKKTPTHQTLYCFCGICRHRNYSFGDGNVI